MERKVIEQKVCEIIKEHLGVEHIDLDADLQKDYKVDSIGVLDFIMSVEDAFDIQFDDESLHTLKTPNEMIDLLEGKLHS